MDPVVGVLSTSQKKSTIILVGSSTCQEKNRGRYAGSVSVSKETPGPDRALCLVWTGNKSGSRCRPRGRPRHPEGLRVGVRMIRLRTDGVHVYTRMSARVCLRGAVPVPRLLPGRQLTRGPEPPRGPAPRSVVGTPTVDRDLNPGRTPRDLGHITPNFQCDIFYFSHLRNSKGSGGKESHEQTTYPCTLFYVSTKTRVNSSFTLAEVV